MKALTFFCRTAASVVLMSFLFCYLLVAQSGKQAKDSLEGLPTVRCALVLGTAKNLGNGRLNQYYTNRIEAAVRLYNARKCQKIIVSGSTHRGGYNEPLLMRQDLEKKGIPAKDIICDYAGDRTIDSVIRFKEIFGQTRGIIVSQKFHNARAIYIAQHYNIELTGYNAQDVSRFYGIKTKLREFLARLVCVWEMNVYKVKPKYPDEKVNIDFLFQTASG